MKRLLTIILILGTAHLAFAQGGAFGPRVSLTSTNLNLEDNINAVQEGDAEFGYQFGVFARLNLGKVMLMPELLFTDTNSSLSINNAQADLDFNKIDVPVLLGFKFLFFRLQVGPSFSFLTKAESTDVNGTIDDIKDNYKSTTVGYQAGVGMDLLNLIAIDLKYEGNLSNFADASNFINTDQRQSQIVLAIGLKLISRKKDK